MHYWRLNPARWRRCLESMRRLGLGMVATYVPWEYHELAPGSFDFAGRTEPERNLVGFLELCGEMGFHVFIRPGPYIYAEWTNAGVPDRVVSLPRWCRAYRREAEVWMRAVTDAIRPFFATTTGNAREGPIVLFQPDNETDIFSHWFEDACGLSRGGRPGYLEPDEPTLFSAFARETYNTIDALNESWGTSFTDFDQAHPHASRRDGRDPASCRRHLSYWRFQHWAIRTTLRWHADTYRSLGVGLPMVGNYYPGGDVQNWRELSSALTHGGAGVELLAIDWYPRNNFEGAPTPAGAREGESTGGGGIFGLSPRREERIFRDTCKLQSLVSPVPMIAEFECGVWHGYHEYTGALTPAHYRRMFAAARQAGIKAINWYMFVGRDNWYYTPINERGDIRPELGEVFIELHKEWHAAAAALPDAQPCIAAYLDFEHIATDDKLASNPVLQSLHDAGVPYDMWEPDLSAGRPEPTVLLYASAHWLPKRRLQSLLDYANRGGILVFLRDWPRLDDRFEPCNILHIPEPDIVLSHLGKKVEIQLPACFGSTTNPTAEPRGGPEGGLCAWTTLPPTARPIRATQVAGRQQAIENADKWMTNYQGRSWTIGAALPRGKGWIVALGIHPTPDLVRAIAGIA
jgi:hypothetical protein